MRVSRFVLLCLTAGAPVAAREAFSAGAFLEASGPVVDLDAGRPDPETFSLWANDDVYPGLELRYGRYGARASIPLYGVARAYPERPPTKFFDLRLRYLGDRWGGEGYAQYYRGFWLEDAEETVLRDHPGLKLRNTNVNIYRAIGKASRIWRLDEPLPSTGLAANAYGVFGAGRQSLESPAPFLVGAPVPGESAFDGMTRLSATSLFGGVGLTVNTNLLGLYFDPTLMIAYAVQNRDSDRDVEAFGGGIKVHIKLAMGYTHEYFDLGFQIQDDGNSLDLGDEEGAFFNAISMRIGLRVFLPSIGGH